MRATIFGRTVALGLAVALAVMVPFLTSAIRISTHGGDSYASRAKTLLVEVFNTDQTAGSIRAQLDRAAASDWS